MVDFEEVPGKLEDGVEAPEFGEECGEGEGVGMVSPEVVDVFFPGVRGELWRGFEGVEGSLFGGDGAGFEGVRLLEMGVEVVESFLKRERRFVFSGQSRETGPIDWAFHCDKSVSYPAESGDDVVGRAVDTDMEEEIGWRGDEKVDPFPVEGRSVLPKISFKAVVHSPMKVALSQFIVEKRKAVMDTEECRGILFDLDAEKFSVPVMFFEDFDRMDRFRFRDEKIKIIHGS